MDRWISRLLRGQLVIVATGSGYGGKPRPALIVQSDLLDAKPTLIVLGFTNHLAPELLWRPMFEPSPSNGLEARSALMADNPVAALRSKIDRVIGHFSPSEMRRVDDAVSIVFGLN